MGRSCCTEPQQAISAALDQFWLKGFSACSLKQLEDVTEMNPGSLYYHFKSKEQLYLKALSHYIDKFLSPRVNKYLVEAISPIQLRRFFTSGYRNNAETSYRNCCFLVFASHELHLLPVESRALIKKGIEILNTGFNTLLKAPGVVSCTSDINIESLSDQLVGIYLSLQVMARIEPNQHSLDRQVNRCLNSLFPSLYPEKQCLTQAS